MLWVYACEFDLEGASADVFDEAIRRVTAWIGDRYGDREGLFLARNRSQWIPEAGASVRWHGQGDKNGSALLWTIEWTRTDQDDPEVRWKTEVRIGRESVRTGVAVRVGRECRGPLVPKQRDFPRPNIVNVLLGAQRAVADGRRLREEPEVFDEKKMPALCTLLANPERRLPVVLVSVPNDGTKPLVDERRLGALLAGLAHVVRLRDKAASLTLAARFGKQLSTFEGAVRVYWPGFSRSAHMLDHPLYLRDRIREFEVSYRPLADRLLADLAPLQTDRIPLRAMQNKVDETLRLVAAALPVSFEGTGEFNEALELAWRAQDALEQEVAELRSRIPLLEDSIATLDAELARSRVPAEVPSIGGPRSVVEAVRRAAEQSRNLVFLDAAFESAEHSPYEQPGRIYDDLISLDEIAAEYKRGDLPAGLIGAFEDRGIPFRPGVSDTARRQYPGDYRRSHRGRALELGPHIARGAGTPRTMARIYFAIDEDRTFVVGHIGLHLRDASTG